MIHSCSSILGGEFASIFNLSSHPQEKRVEVWVKVIQEMEMERVRERSANNRDSRETKPKVKYSAGIKSLVHVFVQGCL